MKKHRRDVQGLAGAAAAVLLLGLVGCWGRTGSDGYLISSQGGSNQVTAVAVADLNGDGKLDLVSSTSGGWGDGFVSVDLQDPTAAGAFLAPVRSDAGQNPAAFAVVNFTPGGRPGLVVVNPQTGPGTPSSTAVAVLLPDPATPGGFLEPAGLAIGSRKPSAAVASNPAASGTPFIAVAADGGSDVLVFFQGATPGTYGAATSVPAGGQPTAVAIADLNGDGFPDLAVPLVGNTVAVILQDPSHPGTFLAPVSYAVGVGPVALAVADLNGDGHPDLVVANGGTATAPTNQGLTVLLQDPANAGAFLPGVTYAVGDYLTACVAVGDLNGDGLPDLAVANLGLPGLPGSVALLMQNPAAPGTFQAPVVYPGQYGPSWVAIGDLNSDGLPDLAVADGEVVVRFQVAGQPGVFGPPFAFYR